MKLGKAIRIATKEIPFLGDLVNEIQNGLQRIKVRRKNRQIARLKSMNVPNKILRHDVESRDATPHWVDATLPGESFQKPVTNSVAVVIAFYNGEKWIERAIRSVLNQSVKPDEFIIVNDGSRPEEREHLGRLAEIYDFRIVDKPNGGQGSARNAGVHVASSEFISFLDQDDFYLPQHLEDLLAIVPNDLRLGFVYGDLCVGNEFGQIQHSRLLSLKPGQHPKQGNIASLISTDMFVLPSASLIKRSAYLSLGGFDEQFIGCEDDDLFLRMCNAGFTNYYLDKPVTVWCRHRGSASSSIMMSQSRLKYFKKLCATFPDDRPNSLFYFRDCLLPRFGDRFMDDAVKAHISNHPQKAEFVRILKEFCEIVDADPATSKRYKRIVHGTLCDVSMATRKPGLSSWLTNRMIRIGRKAIPRR